MIAQVKCAQTTGSGTPLALTYPTAGIWRRGGRGRRRGSQRHQRRAGQDGDRHCVTRTPAAGRRGPAGQLGNLPAGEPEHACAVPAERVLVGPADVDGAPGHGGRAAPGRLPADGGVVRRHDPVPAADWRAARLASEWSGRLVRKHPWAGIETEKARTRAQEREMRYPSPSSVFP